MLLELRIAGLAVFGAARLQPGPAMTALTGETGSGKSLCVSALRLALGGRLDAELVRHGEERASVGAVFDEVPPGVASRLEANGIPDDELLTLTRDLSRSGRGACRVNGALVSLATLRSIGDELVEITGQGESHLLLRPSRQRRLLDEYAGGPAGRALAELRERFSAWRDAQAAVARAEEAARRDAAEVERARELVAELAPLLLRVGEDAELAAERVRLRHAGGLAAAGEAVRAAAVGSDDSGGAGDALAAAAGEARRLVTLDHELAAIVVACDDLVERLRDLGGTARAYVEGLEVDPGRLAAVEERLDVLDRVRRRHGSVEAAMSALAEAAQVVDAADDPGRASSAVVERLERARDDAAAAAAELSALRGGAAARLERTVTDALHSLELPHAHLRVGLRRVADDAGLRVDGVSVACTPDGVDEVEMRLSTTPDGVPLPLAQVASGGELSRLALALRAAVSVADDCPTLVLDEVDAGIGGETAARVGETLAAIAVARQVIVVTHRPEIAARAGAHLLVDKHDSGATLDAEVRAVDGAERETEMARLMSGRATDAALVRARELLAEGVGAG